MNFYIRMNTNGVITFTTDYGMDASYASALHCSVCYAILARVTKYRLKTDCLEQTVRMSVQCKF